MKLRDMLLRESVEFEFDVADDANPAFIETLAKNNGVDIVDQFEGPGGNTTYRAICGMGGDDAKRFLTYLYDKNTWFEVVEDHTDFGLGEEEPDEMEPKNEASGEEKWPGNITFEEQSEGDFDQWFQAVYDYVDVNLGKNTKFMNSPAFEKEAHRAFNKGEDPYTFMTEYLAGKAEYSFGEGIEEAFGSYRRFSPTMARAARQTPGGSANMDQPILDDDPPEPQSEYDEYDFLGGLADFELTPKAKERYNVLAKKFGGPIREADTFGHTTKGKGSHHAEKEMDRIDREKRANKSSRAASKHSRMFGEPDPDEDMFFGSPDQSDIEGGEDDYADEGDIASAIAGVEDPTSSKVADDALDTFGDEPEEVGFGTGIDADEFSEWGPEGHGESPGSDVRFPGQASPEEDPDLFGPPEGYWGTRHRKAYEPAKDIGRHSDIEKALSFPDDESEEVKDMLRKQKSSKGFGED